VEVVAVVVDSDGRNEAMRERWRLPFRVVSDPDGDSILKPLDLWNPHERGGIGWPALVLLDADGSEVFRFRSRDFADRPSDDDVIDAARTLGRAPIDPPPVRAAVAPEQHEAAFRVSDVGPYFRAIRFATMALSARMTCDADGDEARSMSAMAQSFLDAWKQRRADSQG
jgi:hypothetical protein